MKVDIRVILLFFTLSLAEISTNPDDIKFYLHKLVNGIEQRFEIIFKNEETAMHLFPNQNLTLIQDGFLSDESSKMSLTTKNAILDVHPTQHNVVVVGWGKLNGATEPPANGDLDKLRQYYEAALRNARDIVGKRINAFICFVKNIAVSKIKYAHIIGHSLGGISAHYAGKEEPGRCGKIDRITGLDPAGVEATTGDALTTEDSTYVDVYHSDVWGLGMLGGTDAHINVFINGGVAQPTCQETFKGITDGNICRHSYSWKFFAYTFKNLVMACPCDKRAFSDTCRCRPRGNCIKVCGEPTMVGYNMSIDARGPLRVYFENKL